MEITKFVYSYLPVLYLVLAVIFGEANNIPMFIGIALVLQYLSVLVNLIWEE